MVAGTTFIACGQGSDASSSINPIDLIQSEIAAGNKTVSVPCASYQLAPRDGATCYLELRGLSGVTLDFCGSELIGTVKTSMFDLDGCTNVTIRNVCIDYADLPFTQARVESVSADGAWDKVRASAADAAKIIKRVRGH